MFGVLSYQFHDAFDAYSKSYVNEAKETMTSQQSTHIDLRLICSFSMQSIQNLGLAVISQVAGMIVDQKGYLVLEVFFCAWLCGMC